MTQLTCLSCPAPITPRSKTGLCRSCASSRPTPPEVRAKMREAARDRWQAELATEAGRERAREAGRRVRRNAKRLAPDAEIRRREAISNAALGWCPPEWRDRYATLRRKVGAAEARRLIEQDIPGTRAHARRQIDNFHLTQRLHAEREAAQSY